MSGVEGLVLGIAIPEILAAIKKGGPYIFRVFNASACRELKETLNSLKPIVDKIYIESLKSSSEEWLMSIQEFQRKLSDGLRLVEESEKTSSVKIRKKFKQASKIRSLMKLITNFINLNIVTNTQSDIIILKNIVSRIDAQLQQNSSRTIFEHSGANAEQQEWSLGVPNKPSYLVGMDGFLMDLKVHVLDTEVSVVGITALSGMGKSTLATALCHDDQIKEHFKKIIYIPVSKSPNIMGILTDMCERIVSVPKPGFNNYEEARNQLQCNIERGNQPTLVVLDNVCSQSDLQELLFKGEHYKTVVTTRDERIMKEAEPNTRIYSLPLLKDKDALSLFCHCAFGKPNIPTTHDRDLVKKVQEECKGLPVALQVIGRSLRDRDPMFWRSAKDKLSRGETISSYHDDLNERLKTTCIDDLEDDEKQCFLDLAAFPEGRTVSANALLDIWVYVRGMDWADAFILLSQFADCYLLTLERDPGSPRIAESRAWTYGLSFSQHDVIRDLALYLVKRDNKINYSRLCMPEKLDDIPEKWLKVPPCEVKIVSIHTGTMDEERWQQMEFPEAEALVLYFTAENGYCIPTFLGTMKKLKVLIINNYSARRAKVRGLNGLKELSQLKTLQLERLVVTPLYRYFNFLTKLEKLSLSLCEGLGDMSRVEDKLFSFPSLLEFSADHCSDLEGLPRGICSSNFLKLLLVRNCHQLLKLPDELGKLEKLEELSLCACPRLEALPYSIHSLQHLEILDISYCGSLKMIPDKFQELPRLKKVDMSECRKLPKFCKMLGKLESLNHVICSEKNGELLKPLSNVEVEVVLERFDLDWLY